MEGNSLLFNLCGKGNGNCSCQGCTMPMHLYSHLVLGLQPHKCVLVTSSKCLLPRSEYTRGYQSLFHPLHDFLLAGVHIKTGSLAIRMRMRLRRLFWLWLEMKECHVSKVSSVLHRITHRRISSQCPQTTQRTSNFKAPWNSQEQENWASQAAATAKDYLLKRH